MDHKIIIASLIFAVFLTLALFFYRAQQLTLQRTYRHNRKIKPYQVWLQLIPIFGSVWQFVVFVGIYNALKKQFREKNISTGITGSPLFYTVGIGYCISSFFVVVPNEVISYSAMAVFSLCWIIYWIKLTGYKRLLDKIHAHNDVVPQY